MEEQPKESHTGEVIEVMSASVKSNLITAISSGAIFFLGRLIQDNNYGRVNFLSGVNEFLCRSTSLTAAPRIVAFSSIINVYLSLHREEAYNQSNTRKAALIRVLTYIVPPVLVLANTGVELMGGKTTPDIGPDSLSGDIISGIIGGSMALLANVIIDKRSQKVK
ncbi:hypothetical protein ACFLY9_01795 [Patescibacteria group bacterium]